MSSNPAPRWFIAVAVILTLPVFQLPLLISVMPSQASDRTLLWVYPFYAVASAWLACRVYAQRPALAWILLAVLVLSHAAMWMLALTPVEPMI